MLGTMFYVDLFRDANREGGFYRINSTYSEETTVELAQKELIGNRFPWAAAYEVVNDDGDILAVGIKNARRPKDSSSPAWVTGTYLSPMRPSEFGPAAPKPIAG